MRLAVLLALTLLVGAKIGERLAGLSPLAPTISQCGWDMPILPEVNDHQFTEIAYQTILKRDPDPRHLALEDGYDPDCSGQGCGWTRASLLVYMIDSDEFRYRLWQWSSPVNLVVK